MISKGSLVRSLDGRVQWKAFREGGIYLAISDPYDVGTPESVHEGDPQLVDILVENRSIAISVTRLELVSQ
jgi:hypothetical protein